MTGESLDNRRLRLAAAAFAILLAAAVFLLGELLPATLRASVGIVCFIAVCVAFSTNVRAIRWRIVFWGLVLQIGLALIILKLQIGELAAWLRVLRALV